MRWQCKNRSIDLASPIVMGVLNVTPDSFSDGGRYAAAGAAFDRAVQMIGEGAQILDIGGESTKPGSSRIPAGVQIQRVVPVIERIAASQDVAISIDTSEPDVMRAAISAGACIVNDVSALRRSDARAVCAAAGVGVCLMHMQGEPLHMQDNPQYGNVVTEVGAFLTDQRALCIQAGIAPGAVVFDPGLGFGKSFLHNMTLLKEIRALSGLGSPLLIGVARKSFIGKMLGKQVHERLYGGLGLAVYAVIEGARIIRTHDVAPTVEAIGTVTAVLQGSQYT